MSEIPQPSPLAGAPRRKAPAVSTKDDVAPEESEAILTHLERAIMSPNVQCRFRWEKDSIAMWDNRSTQHFATNDFWPEERRMERVTIVGDVPY